MIIQIICKFYKMNLIFLLRLLDIFYFSIKFSSTLMAGTQDWVKDVYGILAGIFNFYYVILLSKKFRFDILNKKSFFDTGGSNFIQKRHYYSCKLDKITCLQIKAGKFNLPITYKQAQHPMIIDIDIDNHEVTFTNVTHGSIDNYGKSFIPLKDIKDNEGKQIFIVAPIKSKITKDVEFDLRKAILNSKQYEPSNNPDFGNQVKEGYKIHGYDFHSKSESKDSFIERIISNE